MKYLHICNTSIISIEYIKFINKNFNKKDHRFLFFLEKEKVEEYLIDENVSVKQNRNFPFKIVKFFINFIFNTLILLKELKNTKNIYLHGLFDKKIIIFLFLFRKYLKKSNWIVWGGDLHCYEKRKKGLKYKVWYSIEDYVKRNISYINTLVPDDYEIVKKYYKARGKYGLAIYPDNFNYTWIDNLKIKLKEEVYIQIGNSADPSNNHFEIIDLLSKFKNEKIKIYAILSYGDKKYAKKVSEYGKEILGEKFIAIFEFMKLEKYWNYLKNIDILIFDHKRQQGLGNIEMFSYLEKKIYLRNDVSSWNYLVVDLGLKLNITSQIKNESFDEFKTNNSQGNKKKILKTRYSTEYAVMLWKKIFNID